ncbi:glycoside hydrolase family 6 protein [Cellulomonas soli]|uniref:glycoside hydrolase family 6 protein n=1 Tax=Cellulomonas soli TaxID=931535 RepID=UPI003F8621D9
MSEHGKSRVRRRVRAAATAVGAFALVAAPLTLTTTASAVEAHVDNPYAGATQYVNPSWSAKVEAAASRQSDAGVAAQMRAVKDQPTAVWMDRISAIAGNVDGNGLQFHLDEALEQKQGATPIVLNLVIYDLPGRDCFALASNGELPATDAGLARYKSEYIDAIVDLLAQPQYADLRIAATIEPDSLPNLVTNISEPLCQQAAPYYRAGVKYALDELHALPNVYTYLDAGHSGWLGWDSNAGPSAKLFAEVARTTSAGLASVDGFVTNTANSTPLVEPFLTDSSAQVGGSPVRSASFYEWNYDFDEIDWTAHLYRLLVAEGFPASTGMLIDTSRNGWGGTDRPTAASTSTVLNTYVNESRVDGRVHRGAWCNPLGAGIGERPQASPAGYASSHLDAFVWIKPPGESDGASSDIPNDEGKRFDRMCDPTFVSPKLANQLTGATPNAPLAGQWFEEQFVTLVKNAYPAITGGTTPGDTTAPSVPTGLSAGTPTATTVPLSWSASTDEAGGSGVSGYQVYRGTTLVATTASTSYTVTGLTASTAYSFTVRAKDVAGNVSAPSSALAVTTAAGGPVDSTAPSVPTGLTVGTVTASSVPLTWNASSDGVGGSGVAGYDVYRGTTLVASTTSTSYTVTGLSAGTTYSFAVRAKDVAGNVSALSAAVSATTTTVPAAGCTVTYTANSWSSGFTGSVRITNTGTSTLNGWSLGFAFTGGQQVTQGWSAAWSQTGAVVTATNLAWNGTLAPGASTDIGFNGSHSGSNPSPTAFTLNGASCTVA